MSINTPFQHPSCMMRTSMAAFNTFVEYCLALVDTSKLDGTKIHLVRITPFNWAFLFYNSLFFLLLFPWSCEPFFFLVKHLSVCYFVALENSLD